LIKYRTLKKSGAMKNNEIYLLNKKNAEILLEKGTVKELFLELKEEDIIVEEIALKLHQKKKLKRKSGDIIRYEWYICFAPGIYIDGFQHDVYIDKEKEYENMFHLAVRKGEFEEIDKKVLKIIEYKPFYINQKRFT